MSNLLFHFQDVHPTTWFYLSSLLVIALFFKFNRFWSVRNLDLALLILLAPGLLFVHFGERLLAQVVWAERRQAQDSLQASRGELVFGTVAATSRIQSPELPDVVPGPGDRAGNRAEDRGGSEAEAAPEEANGPATPDEKARNLQIAFVGYAWLLGASGLFLVRLLLDPMMVRRPLLEPNLSTGGLVFLGCALLVVMMTKVISTPTTSADLRGPKSAAQLLSRDSSEQVEDLGRNGPGNALLHSIPALLIHPIDSLEPVAETRHVRLAKLMAVLSNLVIVLGIVLIGYRHFGSAKTGIGAAILYLLLPYTSLMAGHVDHVLPAALLVWGVLCYRQPLTSGVFIGLAIGVVYYPLFLLPLWISFYWERGLGRFLVGVISMVLLSVGSLMLVSADSADFLLKVRELFGIWLPKGTGLAGIWGLGWNPAYRYSFLAGFIAISGAFAVWPAQKNLGTLLSCSSAVMVATQFWHGHGGGLFMAWFLPLTLLTVFRPNLEDRVALTVLGDGWFPRRKHRTTSVVQAA